MEIAAKVSRAMSKRQGTVFRSGSIAEVLCKLYHTHRNLVPLGMVESLLSYFVLLRPRIRWLHWLGQGRAHYQSDTCIWASWHWEVWVPSPPGTNHSDQPGIPRWFSSYHWWTTSWSPTLNRKQVQGRPQTAEPSDLRYFWRPDFRSVTLKTEFRDYSRIHSVLEWHDPWPPKLLFVF